MALTLSALWLDANQGLNRDDRAFGYIGTDEQYEDEDGESQQYAGWFFEWPGGKVRISSEAERQSVIDSLEVSEVETGEPIPRELAKEKLTAFLETKFPGDLDEKE